MTFVDIDTFQRETTPQEAARLCGSDVEITGEGRNVRIDCPFNCSGDHARKREIAVDTENAAKQWKCHAYGCECRGNLLNLMYGWIKGQRCTGDRLRGKEFNEVKQVIAGDKPAATPPPKLAAKPAEQTAAPKTNPPLLAGEKSRLLMEPPIWEKLVTEIEAMSPEASAYVRRHPALSAASMEKWHVGLMPKDGGGDKRGWSLRDHIVYPFLSEENEVIAFVGRDPKYDEKLQAFEATSPAERDPKQRHIKHKFPKGFHRGLELFGQQRGRLEEPGYREAIAGYGPIIVEGFNDVIQLDALQIPAVAICSNRVTDEQVAKLVRLSNELAAGRVSLFFDCDDEGNAGARDAAWKLLQAGLAVRPAWGEGMHEGAFQSRQPESITRDELQRAILPAIGRK